MGEIRSTIDIMMERTRGLKISAQEREEIRREELTKRAKGLKLKIDKDPDNAASIITNAAVEEADRPALESILWELLINQIPDDDTAFQYLKILEQIPRGTAKKEVLVRLRHELRSVLDGSKDERKKALNREKKKLASAGISGSAVVPKLPADYDEMIKLREVRTRFQKELVR